MSVTSHDIFEMLSSLVDEGLNCWDEFLAEFKDSLSGIQLRVENDLREEKE
jgi:hypothetical protein